MNNKFLLVLLISLLSISLLIGCSNNSTEEAAIEKPSVEDTQDTSSNDVEETPTIDNSDEENKNTASDTTDDENELSLEESLENKFTEAMDYLYNNDYSDSQKTSEAEAYIKENFTPEGSKDMINKILSYGSEVTSSDFLITLTKKVENTDERYASMYEIRYNISVSIGKPSIYSDIIACLVVDNDGNIFIDKINNFNF